MGFEHRYDAECFLAGLRERFAKFGLELHPDKTRLIEFGRYAERNRRRRGERKPETFNFLGFTHSCAKTRSGRFTVLRQTMRTRWQAKLREVKDQLRRRLHHPVLGTGRIPAFGRHRSLPVLRRADERQGAGRVLRGHRTVVVSYAAPAESTPPGPVGTHAPPDVPLAASAAHLPALSLRAPRRRHPRWEPDAVVPLVRICAGGAGRPASLPRHPERRWSAHRAAERLTPERWDSVRVQGVIVVRHDVIRCKEQRRVGCGRGIKRGSTRPARLHCRQGELPWESRSGQGRRWWDSPSAF